MLSSECLAAVYYDLSDAFLSRLLAGFSFIPLLCDDYVFSQRKAREKTFLTLIFLTLSFLFSSFLMFAQLFFSWTE